MPKENFNPNPYPWKFWDARAEEIQDSFKEKYGDRSKDAQLLWAMICTPEEEHEGLEHMIEEDPELFNLIITRMDLENKESLNKFFDAIDYDSL